MKTRLLTLLFVLLPGLFSLFASTAVLAHNPGYRHAYAGVPLMTIRGSFYGHSGYAGVPYYDHVQGYSYGYVSRYGYASGHQRGYRYGHHNSRHHGRHHYGNHHGRHHYDAHHDRHH